MFKTDIFDLIDLTKSISLSINVADFIPLDSASKESIPLPEKRSKDDEHKPISITLKSVSLMNAFDGLRFGLSGISINRDLCLPDIILNLLFNCLANSEYRNIIEIHGAV